MITSTINLTIFIIMIIIYLNEMRNISMFIFNFNYIKDFSKIIMEQKCNNIYCEAETDRYNIAKNSYNLLLPNDIFNSKTYIIFVFILSILIYIYYYYILISDILISDSDISLINIYIKNFLHILLFAIILGIIITRYVPNEETGYLNYFQNTSPGLFIGIGFVIGIIILGLLLILSKKKKDRHYTTNIIIPCFMLSFILLLNLLNIVLTFRNNTKPILKTKKLLWSLRKSVKYENNKNKEPYKEPYKKPSTPPAISTTSTPLTESKLLDLYEENAIITLLLGNLDKDKDKIKTKENIQYVLNILNAYSELSKIKSKSLLLNDTNKVYINTLKEAIRTNNKKFDDSTDVSKISEVEVSLIYDKKVKIPSNYDATEHLTNANSNNKEYIYTADISYDNSNLFYEKYWDITEKNMNGIPQFLWEYEYFTPPMFLGYKPNLFKILILVLIFIFIAVLLIRFNYPIELYNILLPLITFAILIIFILIFICFNTWFNKYVVYKCLDCSYKRSLNKLNNIVTPYIRLYDNKIIKGNKNYTHHYIISNVFYSILCGYIKLNNDTVDGSNKTSPINESEDNKKYYDITKINSNRLKFASMNSNILNNDNEFREYYKAKFKDVYKKDYTDTQASSLYNIIPHIFSTSVSAFTDEASINNYFTDIINKDNIKNIFKIIKKCLDLFEENKFNNNLIYYNNRENKNKDVNIDIYNKFKFYKNNDKIIPYKFILKLTTYTEFQNFINIPKDKDAKFDNTFAEMITNNNILDDNNDASYASDMQASDMEKIQDNYLIKIIAKYLLIIWHININRIEYKKAKADDNPKIDAELNKEKKRILENELNIKLKEIYERKTYHLYKLFSNTLYKDTYEINDTFTYIKDTLIITTEKYKNLTYIYNFLETKYVSISFNNNNNYLANIIKSINNKINNDDKTFINNNKNAQYIFRDNIDKMNNPGEYEDDQEILNVANNVSTIDFGLAYGFNMLVLILYYYFILKNTR